MQVDFLDRDKSTITTWIHADLAKDGPIGIRPAAAMLGGIYDMWFRNLTDLGIAGSEHGNAGKNLVLSQGHDGEVQELDSYDGDSLKQNANGFHDIHSAPKSPKGQEGGRLQAVPGNSWFVIQMDRASRGRLLPSLAQGQERRTPSPPGA